MTWGTKQAEEKEKEEEEEEKEEETEEKEDNVRCCFDPLFVSLFPDISGVLLFQDTHLHVSFLFSLSSFYCVFNSTCIMYRYRYRYIRGNVTWESSLWLVKTDKSLNRYTPLYVEARQAGSRGDRMS